MDYVILLAKENGDNYSIIYYALKLIMGYNLTSNAKTYLTKVVVSLSLLYPYVVPLLKEYIFEPYNTSREDIGKYSNMIFEKYFEKNNFEACAYAIMYMIDSNMEINSLKIPEIIKSRDCILLLLVYLYCKQKALNKECKELKAFAKELISSDEMDQFWLFIYESLGYSLLKGSWVGMKKAGVSFIKEKYR